MDGHPPEMGRRSAGILLGMPRPVRAPPAPRHRIASPSSREAGTGRDLPAERDVAGRVPRLAWPVIGEQLLLTLVGVVDIAMVGRLGASAVAAVLDSDELVRQERESLKRLQDNLREQSKQAEVDISLERAKLARERAELEEKLRGLEAEKANLPSAGGSDGSDKGKKQGRKWLARLGLGENKDE